MGRERGTILGEIISWLPYFLIALALMLFVRTFVVEPFKVPTGSMEHTIEIGDYLVAEKVSFELGASPEPGDIVVFQNPDAASGHEALVKRVIAVAGQTVDLVDGRVYVDGVALDESFAVGPSYPLPTQADGVEISFPYTVPEGALWVMGDNRTNSLDSRYFGAVDEDLLIGRAIFRYWPFDRVGTL